MIAAQRQCQNKNGEAGEASAAPEYRGNENGIEMEMIAVGSEVDRREDVGVVVVNVDDNGVVESAIGVDGGGGAGAGGSEREMLFDADIGKTPRDTVVVRWTKLINFPF
jgi:hypothetical protein